MNKRYMHTQIVSENTSEVFFNKKAELTQFIVSQTNYSKFANVVNPFPIHVDKHTTTYVRQIHDILIKAIYALVNNYLIDNDITEMMSLSNNIIKILQICQQTEYKIGVLRPDYLLDKNGQIRICEINARFTTNGILIADILNKFFAKTDCYPNAAITHYIKNFDKNKKVFIIKGKEPGMDIYLLNEYFNNNEINSVFVTPEELYIQGDKLYIQNEECTQIVMELHQDEILSIPSNILEKIITDTHYLNDLRTIFIVHDKRFLALLGNKQVMLKYLNNEEFELLKSTIISTKLLDNKTAIVDVLKDKDAWVLKKCLSGKGDGMYIGKDTDDELFCNVINKLNDLYIAQEYIPQQYHSHITNIATNNIEYVNQLLVGTFISFNGDYLGLGIARGSTNEIINVATGGTIFAVLENNNINLLQQLNNTIRVAQLAPYYKQYKLSNIENLAQLTQIQPLTQDVIRNTPENYTNFVKHINSNIC